MSGSYYDDSDEHVDVHFSRRHASPAPAAVHYVEASRPRRYYESEATFLAPEHERTLIRTRSRSRERRSAAAAPAAGPVIIKNVYNEHSSSDDDTSSSSRSRHRRGSSHHSRPSRSRRDRSTSLERIREQYEIERTRREIEELKLEAARQRELDRIKRDANATAVVRVSGSSSKYNKEEWELQQAKEELARINAAKGLKEEADLRAAQKELEKIRAAEKQRAEEERLKREIELQRLEDEKKAEDERKRRDVAAKAAVEKYKQEEAERQAKEKAEEEQREKDYQRRLQEQLIKSGLDEKAIAAILEKKKVPGADKDKDKNKPGSGIGSTTTVVTERKTTVTRMRRKHLSFETLAVFKIDYEIDEDPDYILIKRWVPEWEQEALWKHTKALRKSRKEVLVIEDKHKHHHHHKGKEATFEFVQKKERRRSRSPSLLAYLAGAKPA